MTELNYKNEDLNLTILMEECAEVIKICSKIKRFGMDNVNPFTEQNNLETLEKELGDLMCMVAILANNGTISEKNVLQASEDKHSNLRSWYD